ncbi:ribosomal protein S15 [Sporothrix schenckii ATCC 58251]|uniref:Ribosomal protein S15 n=1 Tax=Sporothrix schenckii (strain ATCC 58251 / de Perez 2211183) TaxID=1391915 RepID=U7PXQ8_SPOS1|nr:ribosomal protein S15 [Sporothrix schenckii ATCC 58251]
MPLRVPGLQGLSVFNLCLRPAAARPAPSLQPLIQTAHLSQREKAKKKIRLQQPYKWAQIVARKAAKVARQEEVAKAREASWGHHVHGITTPFVESFDTAGQASKSKIIFETNENGEPVSASLPTDSDKLNFQLTKQELDEAVSMAYQLSKPLENTNRILVDAVTEAQELKEHEERHRRAVIALQRISSMDNANSKSRMLINKQRCIEKLGRHNTDQVLRPKPRAPGHPEREELKRGGPDTGSSEVQIAILTAKIRVLAKTFEGPYGHKDKYNRRNLRLLCHRRQRLLKYMERKERGSERWKNMLTTLGLTEATWKQQIEI